MKKSYLSHLHSLQNDCGQICATAQSWEEQAYASIYLLDIINFPVHGEIATSCQESVGSSHLP